MGNIDFPLLRTFSVDDKIVEFLNKKFDLHFNSHNCSEDITFFNINRTDFGYETSNLLTWEDLEYQDFLNNDLLKIISENLGIPECNIEYFWVHILEYQNGGKLDPHKHKQNEDFVIFIYLKTCNTGETVFYLNDYCLEYKKRTTVEILPKSGTASIFSSLILHEGKFTKESKRIFVAGVRVNTITL